GWWRTVNGPALMAALRRRTLSEEEIVTAQKLIADLGDMSFTKRERATMALIAQGSKVVSLLRDAAKTTDLEQSGRIETCLKKIALNEARDKLPASAPRLLVVRKPAGATEALLGFVPFTDDRLMKEEIVKSLTTLVLVEGKAEVTVVKALSDPLPVRRITAAEVLLASGGSKHWPGVRKLLVDADPEVRQRSAIALVLSQDKQAVPALIKLLAELPRGQAWEVEELLHRIAGANAPTVAWDKDDAAARKKLHAAWQAWWKTNAAVVNLAELDKTSGFFGLTLVTELSSKGAAANPLPAAGKKKAAAAPGVVNPGHGTDRLVALDRNGQIRWQIDGMDYPIDFQILQGGRVLVAEYKGKRVTERDAAGNVLWEVPNLPGAPINVQRLSNGNTFIALYNPTTAGGLVMEVDRSGKTVSSINVGVGPAGLNNVWARNESLLIAAHKTADGHLICLLLNNVCIRFDATGKEIKRFGVTGISNAVTSREGNIDVTSKGHVLILQGLNTVVEYDPDGKIVWQMPTPGHRPTRLANGNTLVASETNGVVELDSAGKTVWHYQPPPGNKALRARQVGDSAVAAPRPILSKGSLAAGNHE
ncbi:MAG TPA: HEAT repeat domain-containing protein, partial [Gemmataceae bacterium]|nr:HEAT repeat domain-containing protein [Gemmataceae bacterium]